VKSWGGFLAGLIGLAVLGPVLNAASQSGTGASNLAKLASVPGAFVSRFMDPTVPAFGSAAPNLSTPASSSGAGGTSGTTGAAPSAGAQPGSAGNQSSGSQANVPDATNQEVTS